MSDTEVTGAEASDGGPAALPGDGLREGIVTALRDDLGTGLVDTHLVPQTDLWVRVTPEAWALAGAALKAQGFEFFCFLSAIDWLPSPYGKSEDDTIPTLAEVRAATSLATARPTGTAVGDGSDAEPADGADADAAEVDAAEVDAAEVDAAAAEPDVAAGAEPEDDDEDDEAGATIRTGYAGGESRFQLVARLVDIERHVGVTVKADVPDTLTMPTWIPHFAGANWHEREVHEMFGIGFDGHPDLRNLYLPSDFEGYPLRKDFPLLSRLVKPWPGIADVEPMPDFDSTDGESS